LNDLNEIKSDIWIKIGIYGLILAVLYYASFLFLKQEWGNEDFTYCYLIPPIVLYLIWEKRKGLAALPSEASWAGFVFIVVGFGFFWIGELGGEYTILFLSFWFVLVGLVWSHIGWRKLKIIWFPMLLVFASFTPPDFLYFGLTLRLKLLSSKIGVTMLQIYGMSAYREGNVIDLGFTQLQVVDACSGLRYLFPLFVLGLLLAYFFKTSLWKKAVLVISTIPITIITNSLRIALTGILYELWGPKVAQGFFHGFSGWFIFMFALSIMLLEMWMLSGFSSFRSLISLGSSKEQDEQKRTEGRGLRTEDQEQRTSEHTEDFGHIAVSSEPLGKKGWRSFFSPPQFVVAVILLGLTLVLSQGVEFREKVPISKSFKQFPLDVGGWSGSRQFMERIIIDELDFSDYVTVDYKDKSGKLVNFYTAYYESQRKGESIHSPASCLPGGGWIFREAGSAKIPVAFKGQNSMPVNRAFIEKSDYRQLTYYWFPQRDRVLTNAYQLKLYNFWDALTRQRTDGALVRLITPVYPSEQLADAEKRLQSFTQAIVPVLDEFLPD